MGTEESIQELDPKTVERIAAGEVVERPASVVKELVENSLDADASRVEVSVESGGKDGIRVTDDGIGMSETAVERAVEKHTTSKIRDIGDLESGVTTLGFRGEALHAIGAVSRLTIKTRPRDAQTGTELHLEGGDVTDVKPTGCPEGTTIEIEDLFYNVPARRKYLKQDGTEFAHVNTVVTSYALANPDVAVSLEHNGRETFATTGQGDLKSTVMSVYGRDVATAMVEIDPDEALTDEDGPLDSVSGLVSHPETTRASNEYVTTYVNGRYVRSSTVRDAIVDAYDTQLAPDRYPFAVLFLDLPGDTVDVNVHPRKLKIRFADSDGVRKQVKTAVENALLEAGILRTSAPRGRSAPEQTEIAPEQGTTPESDEPEPESESTSQLDTDTNTNADSDTKSERERETERNGEDEDEGKTQREDETKGDSKSEDNGDSGDDGGVTGTPAEPPTREGAPIGPNDIRDATRSDSDSDSGSNSDSGSGSGSSATADQSIADDSTRAATEAAGQGQSGSGSGVDGSEHDHGHEHEHEHEHKHKHERTGRFRPGTAQARLGEDKPEPVRMAEQTESLEQLPSMRVLGQLQETYIVAETDDGLVLIDQHAADERINYERLRERFTGETATQALADPVDLSVTAREAELFSEYEPALARLGFRAERIDDRTVEVRTVPELVAEAAGPELVRDVLSAFVSGESTAAETVEAAVDDILSDLACYPSITGNTSLTEGSTVDLLERLDNCENPWACPHGRPVVIHIDSDEITNRFERDYPGHQ